MMPQEPWEYERRTQIANARRLVGRIVLGAWALVACAFVFLLLNASDYSSMQWPAAMLLALTLLAAAVLTLVHWLVIVPMDWAQRRKARSQQS